MMDWKTALLGAVGVVGMIQWVKGFCKDAPTWVWGVASAAICFGLSAVVVFVPKFSQWVLLGGAMLACCQLGYETIVKLLLAKINSLNDTL